MLSVPSEFPSRHASGKIRNHLAFVSNLQHEAEDAGLRPAVDDIKQFQANRFRATYRDLLSDPRHAPATRFFLEELYGGSPFVERDRQFGRIAGAIGNLFPASVVDIAVELSA